MFPVTKYSESFQRNKKYEKERELLFIRRFIVGKYYAVLDGHSKKPMILETWDQCKKEVTGAKGVKYKSFLKREDALSFIRLHGENLPAEKRLMRKEESTLPRVIDQVEDQVVIYVDGSYEISTERYAYGLVVVLDEKEVHAECEAVKGEYSSMRNVAGEVMGAMKAMTYAKEQGYKNLVLYFDYQGIESWALGTWKRNNALTMGYHEFYQNMRKDLHVKFRKVKGHSGDRYNDRADELAKAAFLK